MKINKEKILLLTDGPICTNYSGGIMTGHLLRYLLEEKQEVVAFIPWDKTLTPKWDESIIHDVKIISKSRPKEIIKNKKQARKYHEKLNILKNEIINTIKEEQITKIWCISQGDVISELMNYAYEETKVDYVVQVWDPIEWWMKAHGFSKEREVEAINRYNQMINNAHKLITTSKSMTDFYKKKYKATCIEVMPSLEEKRKLNKIEKNKDFHIALSGQVYATEEIKALFDAFNMLKWKLDGRKIYFHFFGIFDRYSFNLEKYKDYDNNIIFEGYLNQKKLISSLNKMDLLYCPYFFSSDPVLKKVAELSFPSKLVSYLATNVPILLHAPSYSSPYKFCNENNCAYLLTEENAQDIKKFLTIELNKKNTDTLLKNTVKVFDDNFSSKKVKSNFLKSIGIDFNHEKKLRIFEINNLDLPGRRFNGYDLLDEINNNSKNIAKQIVTYKTSTNRNVLEFFSNPNSVSEEWKLLALEKEQLSVHNMLSYTTNILRNNDYYINSDIVHYHLIHNTKLSIDGMIDLCGDHPSILTFHDPWSFTGRCVHPDDCPKWATGCKDCEFLHTTFDLPKDNCNSLWKLKKDVYKQLDIDVVVTSQYMMDMLKQSPLSKNFKNVHLIPFGIDLTVYKNDSMKKNSRKNLAIPKDEIVLFFRSQFAFKGTEYIIEAMKELKVKEKVTLLTCGEIGNIDELKKKYNVVELGQIDNDKMIEAYNACDIFLMPSSGESFGLMAVETMAAGRPIIVFDNTALPHVTFAPECGVLVENKNAKKLREAIKMLIENPLERKKRGELGRKLAQKHYDIKVYNQKMLQLYEEVYKRHQGKVVKIKDRSIDYSDKETQKILSKLSYIWKEIRISEKFDEVFPGYIEEKISDDRIDYSNESVREVIKRFNIAIYDAKKNNFLYLPNDLLPYKKKNYLSFKDKISLFLKRNKVTLPLFYVLKFFYGILRITKRTLIKVIRIVKR